MKVKLINGSLMSFMDRAFFAEAQHGLVPEAEGSGSEGGHPFAAAGRNPHRDQLYPMRTGKKHGTRQEADKDEEIRNRAADPCAAVLRRPLRSARHS